MAGGFGSPPAGVYAGPGSFPSNSHINGNYFVDALFDTVDTLRPDGVRPLAAGRFIECRRRPPQWGPCFSKAVTADSVQLTLTKDGTAVAGTTSVRPRHPEGHLHPAAGLDLGTVYTATLSATAVGGSALASGTSWQFTTVVSPPVPGTCPCSLYRRLGCPGDPGGPRRRAADPWSPLLTSTAAGTVTGVRFYKSAGNTGTHTGTLFTAAGEQLATVTFANESSSGWQTATFNQPVAMAANTEYIVAYKSTTGSYSATVNGFGSGLSVGNLRTASDAGAYSYTGDFPSARSGASYLVDVVVQYPDPPFVAGAQTPLPGSSSVALDATVVRGPVQACFGCGAGP